MLGRQVCSVCGEKVHPSDFKTSKHAAYECGTWEQIVAEVERLHRLDPETLELAVRTLLRFEAGYSSNVLAEEDIAPGAKFTATFDPVRKLLTADLDVTAGHATITYGKSVMAETKEQAAALVPELREHARRKLAEVSR